MAPRAYIQLVHIVEGGIGNQMKIYDFGLVNL